MDVYATALDTDSANRSDIANGEMSPLLWLGDGLVLNVSIHNTATSDTRTVAVAGSVDYLAGLSVGASGRSLGSDNEGKFSPRLCGLAPSTRAVLAGQTSGHLANATLAGLVPYLGAQTGPSPFWSRTVGLNSPYPMQDEVG